MHHMGTHPVWLCSSVCYHVWEWPFVVGSLAMGWGYVKNWLLGVDRMSDRDLIRFIRRKQLATLWSKS